MPKQSQAAKKVDYQTLSRQLDEVMAKLQEPDVGVDEAVALYEQALQLIRQLEHYLQTAENKIKQIKASALAATSGNVTPKN